MKKIKSVTIKVLNKIRSTFDLISVYLKYRAILIKNRILETYDTLKESLGLNKNNIFSFWDTFSQNILNMIFYCVLITSLFMVNVYKDDDLLTIFFNIIILLLVSIKTGLAIKQYIKSGIYIEDNFIKIKSSLKKHKPKLVFLLSFHFLIMMTLALNGFLMFSFFWFFVLIMKISKFKY